MVKYTPPMGWNSWNTFGNNISEALIMETADAMVDKGLLAAGYEYVVIDDCWSLKQRDENGRLVADPEKFPHGMKYLSDYIHSKGLKFGMYSCDGFLTCAGYPSSYQYEFIDAKTFADWGVDYLKYDNCYKPEFVSGQMLYHRMGMALENCGRDIMFSACNWGADKVWEWIKTTGSHLFRSTGDINDSWGSIKDLIKRQALYQRYNGQGCFNDMDMLVVGMHGSGNVAWSNAGCTQDEYITHFLTWCFFASPLMIGCDVRNISDEDLKILTHAGALAVNQDPACRQPFPFRTYAPGNEGEDHNTYSDAQIWVKHLDGGDLGLCIINMRDCENYAFIALADLGLTRETGIALQMTDVYTGEDLGLVKDYISIRNAEHQTRLIRCKLVSID